MTRRRTHLAVLVLALITLILNGAAAVEAGGKGGGKGKPGSGEESGGGDGGAGATMVPVIDEDLMFMVQWTRDHLQADAAHQHATGAGVVVAVLDGGFNLNHPDLVGHVSPLAYDAVDDDFDPEDLGNGYDDDGDGFVDNGLGHGTFVAGMVLLAAPDATILPIRVRDDESWGYNQHLEKGLTWAWNAGAQVVNISGSMFMKSDAATLRRIRDMRRDGVAVIVSAGNDGLLGLESLASSSNTLSVGSTDVLDVLAPFSNFDERAAPRMVLAPGVELYGALGIGFDESSGYWSGTSFSTGLVSGAAALVLESSPGLEPLDLYAHLFLTSDPAFDEQGMPLPVSGRINLFRAVTE